MSLESFCPYVRFRSHPLSRKRCSPLHRRDFEHSRNLYSYQRSSQNLRDGEIQLVHRSDKFLRPREERDAWKTRINIKYKHILKVH